jgi:hypothetical protein
MSHISRSQSALRAVVDRGQPESSTSRGVVDRGLELAGGVAAPPGFMIVQKAKMVRVAAAVVRTAAACPGTKSGAPAAKRAVFPLRAGDRLVQVVDVVQGCLPWWI